MGPGVNATVIEPRLAPRTAATDGFRPFVSSSSPATGSAEGNPFKLFGDDGLTFRDLLDLINPLHHIPVIGTIYRRLTGDTIDPAMRIIGGGLLGGPIGAAASLAGAVVEHVMDHRLKEQLPGTLGPDGQEVTPAGVVADQGQQTLPSVGQAPTADNLNAPVSAADIAPRERPGGWIINAAYGVRDSYASTLPSPAIRSATIASEPASAVAASSNVLRERPGGWIISAAHAARDAYERSRSAQADKLTLIDTKV